MTVSGWQIFHTEGCRMNQGGDGRNGVKCMLDRCGCDLAGQHGQLNIMVSFYYSRSEIMTRIHILC